MIQESQQARWILPKLAAQMLGCTTNDLLALARLGLISRQQTNGGHGRYNAQELTALINYRQRRVSTTEQQSGM